MLPDLSKTNAPEKDHRAITKHNLGKQHLHYMLLSTANRGTVVARRLQWYLGTAMFYNLAGVNKKLVVW